MSIEYKKTVAIMEGECTVEDAEVLLEWVLLNPKGKINLKQCEHMHTAVLQVLMAVKPSVSVWPNNDSPAFWLSTVLDHLN